MQNLFVRNYLNSENFIHRYKRANYYHIYLLIFSRSLFSFLLTNAEDDVLSMTHAKICVFAVIYISRCSITMVYISRPYRASNSSFNCQTLEVNILSMTYTKIYVFKIIYVLHTLK